MARFVFELEAALEQRRGVERARQTAVGALERERLALEERIRAIQRDIAREKEDLREHLAAPAVGRGPGGSSPSLPARATDMRAVRLQAGASLSLVGRAHQAALQLAGTLSRLERARHELMEATTRRKAVEKLRERRWNAWRSAQGRRENAALDELNVMSAPRREQDP